MPKLETRALPPDETDIDTATVDRSAIPQERRAALCKMQDKMDALGRDERRRTYFEERPDGGLVKRRAHTRSQMAVTGKPAVEVDGMSLEKRCKQLFDPGHKPRLERKVQAAMELERRAKKGFAKLSVQQKLQVLDSQRRKGLSQEERRINNLKWQRLGVLDLRNKPSRDLKDNYPWQESVDEIQRAIADKQIEGEVGSRMGATKLEHYVAGHLLKLGYVNTTKEAGHKLMRLSAELHESHKAKARKAKEQGPNSRIEFYETRIYNQDQMGRSRYREGHDSHMAIADQQPAESLLNIGVD